MTPKTETKKRNRRTADQIVADLEAQIAAVKERAEAKAAAKEVKGSADGLAFLAAVKAADRAIRVAADEQNGEMVRALEAARAPLAEHMIQMGVRLPDPKARRGRKRKAVGAA
jgi:N-methylhydantoinase B/oxoprolinase/acetone carboxylase alpha subunit